MKRFLSLIMGITMVMCLCTGCGNKQEYKIGSVSDGVYKNESLNLKYTLPENMKLGNDEEFQKMKQSMSDSMSKSMEKENITLVECNAEFFAKQEGDSPVVVQVVSYKFKPSVSEKDFFKGFPSDEKANLGDTEFYKVVQSRNNIKVVMYVKKVNDYFIAILAMAETEENAIKALSNFSKLAE